MNDWQKTLHERFRRRNGQRPLFLLIGGGSASGKGMLARALVSALGPLTTKVINMDRYFKPVAELPTYHSPRLNGPHGDWNQPDSFRHPELIADMRRLSGTPTLRLPLGPSAHSALSGRSAGRRIHPRQAKLAGDGDCAEDVLILEGILALHFDELREMAHLAVFVHTDADERIVRRLRRNMTQRGMGFDEVADYYLESVRDRHLQYVEPTRELADLVIPGGSRPRETEEREALVAELARHITAVLS